jgi:hypothetical protein
LVITAPIDGTVLNTAPKAGHENLAGETREQMIRKLYTEAYHRDIEELKFARIIGGRWARAFASAPQNPHIADEPQARWKMIR